MHDKGRATIAELKLSSGVCFVYNFATSCDRFCDVFGSSDFASLYICIWLERVRVWYLVLDLDADTLKCSDKPKTSLVNQWLAERSTIFQCHALPP